MRSGSEAQGENRVESGDAQDDGEEEVAEETGHAPWAMHIVFDDDLHAETHVTEDGEERQAQRNGNERVLDARHERGAIGAQMPEDEDDEEGNERNIGNRRDALQPPMLGAGFGGAQTQYGAKRCLHSVPRTR